MQDLITDEEFSRAAEVLARQDTILIDFQGGGYGHFLSGICNLAFGDDSYDSSMLRGSGSSHNVKYTQTNKKFVAFHWYLLYNTMSVNYKLYPRIIEITFSKND